MQRLDLIPRQNWQSKVEALGFLAHSDAQHCYWNEAACYQFTESEIDQLQKATETLHQMCLSVADYIVTHRLYERLSIPESMWPAIERSWHNQERPLFGRFDLAFDGINPPKLLEYNADTPGHFVEASIIQKLWKEEVFPDKKQFNHLHKNILNLWQDVLGSPSSYPIHFTCSTGPDENFIKDGCYTNYFSDWYTLEYLRNTAEMAGYKTIFIEHNSLVWDSASQQLIDQNLTPIKKLYQFYLTEWLIEQVWMNAPVPQNTQFFEPPWKLLICNKGLLPVLWELYPDHEYLLPAYFEDRPLVDQFVKKPIWSNNGYNITIKLGQIQYQTEGDYGKKGYIYQQYQPLPILNKQHVITCSWIIGDQACGLGVNESRSPIAQRHSSFVPHVYQ